MGDSTVIKVDSSHSPSGAEGLVYLASGKSISMRLWNEDPHQEQSLTARSYETVGYVLEGEAELEIEGQTILLKTGDSWVVPKGSSHRYHAKRHFKAVEATHPPFQVHGRDQSEGPSHRPQLP